MGRKAGAVSCRECADLLTEENWYPAFRAINSRICRVCDNKRSATYYHAHRERCIEQAVAWAREHPVEKAANGKAYRQRIRQEVLDVYGNKCKCCGEATPEFLALDHIKGGGNEHRRAIFGRIRAGVDFYLWLKRQGFPQDEYQLLCHNCNFARGHYGRCPHEA